jgi:hypothetical protein
MFARIALCLFSLLVLAFPLAAQELTEWDVDHLELLLPRHETLHEKELWAGREDQMPALDLRDNPPVGPVRNCAEWEPVTGVLIRYPLGLPYNLLRDLDDQVNLHVIVSSSYLSSATSALTSNGVDMDRVQFLVRANDSIWTRDYGPWFIFDAAGEIGIVNHTYNRPWRPNDNLIPLYFGQEMGIPVYSHSMYRRRAHLVVDPAGLQRGQYLQRHVHRRGGRADGGVLRGAELHGAGLHRERRHPPHRYLGQVPG